MDTVAARWEENVFWIQKGPRCVFINSCRRDELFHKSFSYLELSAGIWFESALNLRQRQADRGYPTQSHTMLMDGFFIHFTNESSCYKGTSDVWAQLSGCYQQCKKCGERISGLCKSICYTQMLWLLMHKSTELLALESIYVEWKTSPFFGLQVVSLTYVYKNRHNTFIRFCILVLFCVWCWDDCFLLQSWHD